MEEEERVTAAVLAPEEDELDGSLRPRRLDEFVGQERIKEQLSIVLEAAKGRGEALDHVLLAGPPGLGKTSLAHIIREELGVEIRIVAGPALEKKGDMAWISAENKRLIAENGMTGHFGTWPQSVDMVATRAIAHLLVDVAAGKADAKDSATVHRYIEEEAGGPVSIRRYNPAGNLWLMRMEHIIY